MPPRSGRHNADWQLHPLAAALVAAGIAAPGGATAATLTVTTLAQNSGAACTLRDALHSVNLSADQGACVADLTSGPYGSGDAIVFDPAVSGTIVFSTSDPMSVAPVAFSALSVQRPVHIRGPGSTQLTLRCGSSAFRLMEVVASLPPVDISGLTMTACQTNLSGGGMLVTDQVSNAAATVTLTDVTLTNNRGSAGGAIAVIATGFGSAVTIRNSVIDSNRASQNGGGIFVGASGNGAATVSFTDSSLTRNVATSQGGGAFVQNDAASIIFTRSSVDRNSANLGGGIAVAGGAAALLSSALTGNLSNTNGAGASVRLATSRFAAGNSTVSGNVAGAFGGGIYADLVSAGNVTLANTTVANNRAATGGGVAVENVVSGAQLTTAGLIARNTIIAGNLGQGSFVDGHVSPAGSWDIDFSILGVVPPGLTLNGTGNITDASVPPAFGTAAWLGPLENNGGPTLTHALLTDVPDPAISAGDPAFSGANFDQRGKGFLRVLGGRVDIGAFEADGPAPPPPVIPALGTRMLAVLSGLLAAIGALGVAMRRGVRVRVTRGARRR